MTTQTSRNMEVYADLMGGTEEMLDASRTEKVPYFTDITFEGNRGMTQEVRRVLVLPDVFSPKYFRDTPFFARVVPKYVHGQFVEMGSGTGIISCLAALKPEVKKVIAIDINFEAVRNTALNARLYGVEEKVDARFGNLYNGLNSDFLCPDSVFFNVPFGDWQHDRTDMLKNAVWDPDYITLKKFINQTRRIFDKSNPRAKLLLGFSRELGKYEVLQKTLEEESFFLSRILDESGYVRRGNPSRKVTFQLIEARLK